MTDEQRVQEIEARCEAEAAKRTLEHLGYIYHGGELWKPPIGKPPDFDIIDRWRARAEALERAVKGDCNYCKFGPSIEYQCKRPTGTFCYTNGEYWQLDEERFVGGGGDHD